MKNVLIISLFFLSSCITINTTSTGFKDEIYYSDEDYKINENVQSVIESDDFSSQDQEIESEVDYIDEYSSDDYYDYGYSSRIRRFHSPFYDFGYYHNFYTNSYWYNYNPYNYGVSIYYGYNFWQPHYYHGYHHHYFSLHNYYYHNPYYAGLSYPTYFNSYDNNSIYYGVRQNYNVQKTPDSFANRYVNQKLKNPIINKPQATNNKSSLPANNIRPYNNVNTNSNIKFNQPAVKPQNVNSKPSYNNKPLIKPTYNKPTNSFSKPSQKKPSNSKPVYNKPTRNNSIKSPSVRPSNSRGSLRNNSRRPR